MAEKRIRVAVMEPLNFDVRRAARKLEPEPNTIEFAVSRAMLHEVSEACEQGNCVDASNKVEEWVS
jgi:hypothetical protein